MRQELEVKNKEQWVPTKLVHKANGFVASGTVSSSSRFAINMQAGPYSSYIGSYAKGVLLDLGCGAVPLLKCYEGLVDEIICADWGESLHGSRFIDVEVDLNSALPFPSASFDTVLLTDVLEHVFKPWNVISEVSRVLRAGGHLILTVPFFYWIHEVPHDYFRYTEFSLRRLCEENGLSVVHLDAYGGLPEIFFDLGFKSMAMTRVGRGLCPAIGKGAQFLLQSWPTKRISEKTSRLFPFGYCLAAVKPSHQAVVSLTA